MAKKRKDFFLAGESNLTMLLQRGVSFPLK